MKLIVTHEHADFDALASQVLAQKLHPDGVIIRSPNVGRELEPYLALHRDRFTAMAATEVNAAEVSTLILVDTRSAARLAHIRPLLERIANNRSSLHIEVYDHHASREDDVLGDTEVVERIGAATTLLVERLRARGECVDPVEATLCALGIHMDTGSLTYANVTARDAAALAWLMHQGVSLAQLNRYLHMPFSAWQREVMAELVANVESLELAGLRVGIACVNLSAISSGLDEVTGRALETLGDHALFGIYSSPDRLSIVARARSSLIDVGRILQELGGGGHAGAAAASLPPQDPEQVRARAIQQLEQCVEVPGRVGEIMHSPAEVVSDRSKLADLQQHFEQKSYFGVCVVNDRGRLVGVVSRRDLKKAEQRGLLDRGVKHVMSRRLSTTTPETSLEEALAVLTSADVGRLPVLREGRLVGVVTRDDLIRALYREPQQ